MSLEDSDMIKILIPLPSRSMGQPRKRVERLFKLEDREIATKSSLPLMTQSLQIKSYSNYRYFH